MKKLIKYFRFSTLIKKIGGLVMGAYFISLTSCNVLDIKPTDRLSDVVVWNDIAYIEPFITHTYRNIPNGMVYPLINLSSVTDEMVVYNKMYKDIQQGNLTPNNLGVLDYWSWKNTWSWNVQVNRSYWKPIMKVNVFLKNFNRDNLKDFDSETLDRMEGEMRAIRAFCYLKLIDIFGGVPLVKEPFSLDDDFNVPRNSYDEVFHFALEDLDKAISLLPEDYAPDLKGHITKGAAMAIKARALLYYASPLHNPDNDMSRWQAAADAAKAIIDMGKYSLYPDYHGMFLRSNIYNSEMIWQRPYKNEKSYLQFSFPELSSWPNGYNGYGQLRPLQNLVDQYETTNGLLPKEDPSYDPQNPYVNRDPRFYATILHDGMFWKGREVESFVGGEEGVTGGIDSPEGPTAPWNASETSYYSWKFTDSAIVKPGLYGDDRCGSAPWTWYRYAEVLLNYAEANYFLGNEDVAREYVNMVRNRPGVEMPAITESGDALFQRIIHERQIELVFEQQRWFDIRRWKIAPQVMNVPFKKMTIKKYLDGHKTYQVDTLFFAKFNENRDYLFPIPQGEIEKDPALEQNPGYGK